MKVVRGNILECQAQTLVNTVNCIGVMGKGIALEFRKQFPDMYKDYVARCAAGEVRLGQPYLYRRLVGPWILNFPTKDHWRSVSRLDDIVRGLEYLERCYQEWGIQSLCVPPLGCGNGQLEWRVVGPTLYRHLKRLDIPVTLIGPENAPDEQLSIEFLESRFDPGGSAAVGERVSPGEIALVEILARVLREPYAPRVGRTTFQKMAYFATVAGLPTGLEYRRASFGPFAPELKRVLTRLANNGLIREERRGSMFAVEPGPTYAHAATAYRGPIGQWEEAIERVADLFARAPTKQAEIAATAHFAYQGLVRQGQPVPTESEILAEAVHWKEGRKPPLDEAELADAIRSLNILGWLTAQPSDDLPVPDEDLLYA